MNFVYTFRLGVHLVIRFSLEGIAYYSRLLLAPVHNQIPAQEVLAAIVLETLLESDEFFSYKINFLKLFALILYDYLLKRF